MPPHFIFFLVRIGIFSFISLPKANVSSHDRRLCQYYTDILRLVGLVLEAIKRNRFGIVGIGKQANRRKQGGIHYKVWKKEEGSKLMGSYSSDVSFHLCGVCCVCPILTKLWYIFCFRWIPKPPSKSISGWWVYICQLVCRPVLISGRRLVDSRQIKSFHSNTGKPWIFLPRCEKPQIFLIVLHHISEGSSPFIAQQSFTIIQWYIARSKGRGQKLVPRQRNVLSLFKPPIPSFTP